MTLQYNKKHTCVINRLPYIFNWFLRISRGYYLVLSSCSLVGRQHSNFTTSNFLFVNHHCLQIKKKSYDSQHTAHKKYHFIIDLPVTSVLPSNESCSYITYLFIHKMLCLSTNEKERKKDMVA